MVKRPLLGQSEGDLCQKDGPTLRRSSTYRSGHGTDLDTGKQRQKPSFPSQGPSKRGIRAQGHSAICRARMEELLRGTAKGQELLEEAERCTRDTAGERAAKRIKLQFADRQADSVSSSSASRSDATAGGDAASANNVVAGGAARDAAQTPRCREGMTDAEPSHVRQKMTRNERNDSARRRRRSMTGDEFCVTQRCSVPLNCVPESSARAAPSGTNWNEAPQDSQHQSPTTSAAVCREP